jgi:outer membrane protein TolC
LKQSRLLICVLLLGGCQTYAPAPLAMAPDVLAPPDRNAIARDASTIDRPYLRPATIDLNAPLDGNAVATLAVLGNPDLKALRQSAGVTDAQVFAARLLPDPTLNLGVGNVLSGPDPLADLVGALGLDLNALRNRSVQIAQARAAAEQVRLDLAWSEWQTAGAARIQAVRALSFDRILALQTATQTNAQSLFRRTERAASRGDIAGDQLQTARASLADAEDKARTSENDLVTARLELARLLGLPPKTVLRLADLAATDVPLDSDRLFAVARSNRADIKALEAGYQSQEAALRKAVLDQFPTLNLTMTANRDPSGNVIVGPALDFTLPLWNRNRGGIAIEKATREALRSEYDARLFQARAEIAVAVSGIESARRQRDAARRDLPSVERFATASRAAALRGDIAASVAEAAEQALRDKQLFLAQGEQSISEQMIALELLTGTPREAWTQ